MKDYLYLFRGGDARRVQQSPEEMQSHMQKWGVWMQKLAETGNFISGLPLQKEGIVLEKWGEVVTDAPFAEGNEIVGGYLIVKADSLEQAGDLAKECPIFEHEGTVEVREIAPMDM